MLSYNSPYINKIYGVCQFFGFYSSLYTFSQEMYTNFTFYYFNLKLPPISQLPWQSLLSFVKFRKTGLQSKKYSTFVGYFYF